MSLVKKKLKELPDQKVSQLAKGFIKENQLDRPTKNYCLICPIGLIGSGKTTITKKLARAFSLVRMSTDEIRAYLIKAGYNNERAIAVAQVVTEKLLEKRIGLVIDADCARVQIIKEFLHKAQVLRMPLIWIKIEVPEKIILARLSVNNKKRKYRGPEAIQNYFERKKLHQNIDLPFVYIFKNETPEKLKAQMVVAKQKIQKFLNTWHTK